MMGRNGFTGIVVALALTSGAGCSAKNPAWLHESTSAFCTTRLDQTCLRELAQQSYSDATARVVEQQHPAPSAPALVEPAVPNKNEGEVGEKAGVDQAGATEPATSQELPEPVVAKEALVAPHAPAAGVARTPSLKSAPPTSSGDAAIQAAPPLDVEGSIPTLAFWASAIGASPSAAPGYEPSGKVVEFKEAGAQLRVGEGDAPGELIERAKLIPDPALRADALSGLLTLYSPAMPTSEIDAVLNSIYELDKGKYTSSLIVKLPTLLKLGDLDRAKALRETLLENQAPPAASFSMLAFVVSAYTMAGLKQDASSIIVDEVRGGTDLSADDQKLIGMAIKVSNGSYPAMQDFYAYRSDEVRLHAYLTLAVVARQLDYPKVTHQALADAVKFIQKSSVKIDRQKALGQILALSPGVL